MPSLQLSLSVGITGFFYVQYVDCRSGEVNVYDLLYSDQDVDTLSAISWSLVVHQPPVIINPMSIGKQKGEMTVGYLHLLC